MQTPREIARKRAERGGEWLDTQKPGWFYLIDLGGLDLGCGENCILGQLWASEAMALNRNRPVNFPPLNGFTVALGPLYDMDGEVPVSKYGFLGDPHAGITYELLDEVWIEYIKERVNANA